MEITPTTILQGSFFDCYCYAYYYPRQIGIYKLGIIASIPESTFQSAIY